MGAGGSRKGAMVAMGEWWDSRRLVAEFDELARQIMNNETSDVLCNGCFKIVHDKR